MKEGWEIKTIAESTQIIAGGTPKTSIKEYWDGEIAWITPADLGKLITREVDFTKRTITNEGLQKSSAKLFPAYSVILSSRAPIGHLAINTIPMATNQGCRGIVPNKNLDNTYLYYFIKNNIKLLNELGTGTTFKELSTKALGSVKIPIPPLKEQQQIVAILDQAFETIDQAKANIEKNIANAKELFDSKKEEIFKKLSQECRLLPIIDVCEKMFAGGDKPKSNFLKYKTNEYTIPVISNGEKNNGLFGYTNEAKVLKPSITISARGTIGFTVFRDYPFVPIVRLIVITPNLDIVNPVFLMHAIKSLDILKNGSSIPQLTVPMMKGYSLPIPQLGKQIEILELLNELEIQLSEYKRNLKLKLKDLEDLKKSILQKAFAGELTNKEVEV
jgi:type I restriction enzyme S subunit